MKKINLPIRARNSENFSKNEEKFVVVTENGNLLSVKEYKNYEELNKAFPEGLANNQKLYTDFESPEIKKFYN